MATKHGQAMMELAMGMFAFALVVSALVAFSSVIVKSLKMQNSLRTGASSQHAEVEVGDFAARHIFGSSSLRLHEKVEMPQTIILKGE